MGGVDYQSRYWHQADTLPNSGEGKIAAQPCTFLNFRSAALAVVCVGASDHKM
jgi:hypothetical protein